MTKEKAQIVIGNIPIKPEVLDDCCDITEYQEAKAMAIEALAQESITWIVGKDNCQVAVRNMPIDKMQKICAIIGEEEQQPSEDCISREEVRKLIWQNNDAYGYSDRFHEFTEKCLQLPSVKPKFTDEEIQKMQELEQAQLDKAYELGMQASFEDWLSSFNTDSATKCFTAVQELKKRLESDTDVEDDA